MFSGNTFKLSNFACWYVFEAHGSSTPSLMFFLAGPEPPGGLPRFDIGRPMFFTGPQLKANLPREGGW